MLIRLLLITVSCFAFQLSYGMLSLDREGKTYLIPQNQDEYKQLEQLSELYTFRIFRFTCSANNFLGVWFDTEADEIKELLVNSHAASLDPDTGVITLPTVVDPSPPTNIPFNLLHGSAHGNMLLHPGLLPPAFFPSFVSGMPVLMPPPVYIGTFPLGNFNPLPHTPHYFPTIAQGPCIPTGHPSQHGDTAGFQSISHSISTGDETSNMLCIDSLTRGCMRRSCRYKHIKTQEQADSLSSERQTKPRESRICTQTSPHDKVLCPKLHWSD